MDLQQEAIARGLGEGHRVIHGVAGSGKTLSLAYRCQYLAQVPGKPILVLVYNKALASWLNQQMVEKGISDRVTVRNFHAWCHDQLTLYHVPIPPDGPDFFGRMVEVLIQAVDRGQIPRAQYGALLIDEGHDFEADWLKLVVQMLDPETNSLLLLYDDAQSIYGQRRSSTFSFRSVGISASGRTKILKRNYRNTWRPKSPSNRLCKANQRLEGEVFNDSRESVELSAVCPSWPEGITSCELDEPLEEFRAN
jgi:superfamily I DNA and RNA helicase